MNRIILAEAKEQRARIDKDDPDREHKIYKARVSVILNQKKVRDVELGYKAGQINKRHKDRLRSAMHWAVKEGVVPEASDA